MTGKNLKPGTIDDMRRTYYRIESAMEEDKLNTLPLETLEDIDCLLLKIQRILQTKGLLK